MYKLYERLDFLEKWRLPDFELSTVSLPHPTSVHFHWLREDFGVCHHRDSLWMCLPHLSSAQHSATPSLCHFSVHGQTAPLLISSPPWVRSDFSGLGSLFRLLLSGPALPFVLLQSRIHHSWRSRLLSSFYHSNQFCCCGSICSFSYKNSNIAPRLSFNVLLLLFPTHVKLDFNAVAWIGCFKFVILPICGQ